MSVIIFLSAAGLSASLGLRRWRRDQRSLARLTSAEPLPHPSLAWHGLVRKIGTALPASPKNAGRMRRNLLKAGIRSASAVPLVYGARLVCAAVFPLLFSVLLWRTPLSSGTRGGLILASAALGFCLPDQYLRRKARRRQKQIRRGLPNALDLLVVCVESGLGLDQAIVHVAKELHVAHPEIAEEFAITNLEMKAGKWRTEALHNLAERNSVPDLRKLAAVLIQTDRFGTSVAQGLRNHSDFLRVQTRQQAEEKAAKLGVKLVFPIFFCILPSLFVVTVGPVMARIVRDLLPMMNEI